MTFWKALKADVPHILGTALTAGVAIVLIRLGQMLLAGIIIGAVGGWRLRTAFPPVDRSAKRQDPKGLGPQGKSHGSRSEGAE